ncbi:MAG: hypothetical protein K9G76_09910 [Bacteroidales bacterium]|nr:hypothetical protein [Bacteroidales bacterium]MCF8404014.1 hypothetical protein [Bacteroidales bacterium]
MGSLSQITFADYPIFDNKNWYYNEIVNLIFQPSDFLIEKRKYSTRNKLVWGDAYENEKGYFEFKGFRQTREVCKQRIEIYGNSLKKAKKDFVNAKKIAKQEGDYFFSLSGLKYESYLSEIQSIIKTKEKGFDQDSFSLRDSLGSGDLGIYGQSLECLIFSILNVLEDDDIIEYDLTDVIEGGWVTETQAKSIDIEKIIILTEGKTDVEFILKSLEILYPHLKDYYHFIDFEEYKVESNASALVKLVTSLAAANIKHPIIALFDNDTTGLMEMKKLTSRNLPINFKVLKYPDISLAKKYPTIGPTGKKRMNINGSACGIEMYFGIDVLTKDDNLIPVQWKGFNEKEKKYQGEISEKRYVQETFRKKITSHQTNDMTEMKRLLNEIFNAYK